MISKDKDGKIYINVNNVNFIPRMEDGRVTIAMSNMTENQITADIRSEISKDDINKMYDEADVYFVFNTPFDFMSLSDSLENGLARPVITYFQQRNMNEGFVPNPIIFPSESRFALKAGYLKYEDILMLADSTFNLSNEDAEKIGLNDEGVNQNELSNLPAYIKLRTKAINTVLEGIGSKDRLTEVQYLDILQKSENMAKEIQAQHIKEVERVKSLSESKKPGGDGLSVVRD